jgi:hypothetical protein
LFAYHSDGQLNGQLREAAGLIALYFFERFFRLVLVGENMHTKNEFFLLARIKCENYDEIRCYIIFNIEN